MKHEIIGDDKLKLEVCLFGSIVCIKPITYPSIGISDFHFKTKFKITSNSWMRLRRSHLYISSIKPNHYDTISRNYYTEEIAEDQYNRLIDAVLEYNGMNRRILKRSKIKKEIMNIRNIV